MIGLYISNIIEALESLSDYDFQKVSWFKNDQGLWYDYSEIVFDIFEGSYLTEAIKEGAVVFSKEADKALLELEEACDAIGYDIPESKIIDSPEMAIVRQMATRCLKLIDESDGSESTVKYLKPGELQSK